MRIMRRGYGFFRLKDKGTSIRTEAVAGITTFMTMSYIIFVQPMVLSHARMDFGAVMMATIISSCHFLLSCSKGHWWRLFSW